MTSDGPQAAFEASTSRWTPTAPPTPAAREALNLVNSLGIYGPNTIHAEQGMHPDGKHSANDTWDGPGWCVCGREWPCEAKRLGDLLSALADTQR